MRVSLVAAFCVFALMACGDDYRAGEGQDAGLDPGPSDAPSPVDAPVPVDAAPGPPIVTITTPPPSLTRATSATIFFTCNQASCTFLCSLDGAAESSCTSPTNVAVLAEGAHTFSVRATSLDGQTSAPATANWQIDATAPGVTLTSGPPAVTNDTTATFEFTCSEANCTFQCTLDGGVTACTSPLVIPQLGEATHTFDVRSRDSVGNLSAPASVSWMVDKTPPKVSITRAPTWLTSSTSATFGFSCNESDCSYECSIDGGASAACTSLATISVGGDGAHTLDVRAIDPAGNVGPSARASWNVLTNAPATAVVHAAIGLLHTCAIRIDGTLWCVGDNAYGQLGDGTTTDRLTPTQVGTATYSMVTVGNTHTCALRVDGSLWCWGSNGNGEVGDGTNTNRAQPTQVGTATWSTASSGGRSTCATRIDGSLWCWGAIKGTPFPGANYLPTQVGSDTNWAAVATGARHTCALRRSGTLWCWGWNDKGQLGRPRDYNTDYTLGQVGIESSWATISVGDEHTCATRNDKTLWCWGANDAGQLGNGQRFIPGNTQQYWGSQISNAAGWIAVAAARDHTCAASTDGALWCWGSNRTGALGSGTTTDSLVPQQVGGGLTWKLVSASGRHSCGVREDGTLWCWGDNRYGELGTGAITWLPTQQQVTTSKKWSSLSTDAATTCATRTDGTLWCWGNNSSGQLGDGTTTPRSTPIQVGTDTTWETVETSGGHTCATRADHTLWCWGANAHGELGDGSTTNRAAPTQVGALSTWATVSPGGLHTCATQTDGTLWCWGDNTYGELGDGTTTSRSVPAQVGTDATWAAVSSGELGHTCATRTDGTLWCWGANEALGDSQTWANDRLVPGQVGTETTWATLSAGLNLSCGTQTDGTLWCWGGSGWQSPPPAQASTEMTWTRVTVRGTQWTAMHTDGTLALSAAVKTGDVAYPSDPSPYRLGTSAWLSATSTSAHTCGIQKDHSLWCWGYGASGQLGLGDTWSPQQTFN